MSTKILTLGVHQIQFGVADDPERIKKMVGCKHWLDSQLDPDRFADKDEAIRNGKGIANWPEGQKQAELFAVCFGKSLPNYPAVLEETSHLPTEYADLQRAMFPHLATQLTNEKMAWLWEHNIPWLAATDENSLWRDDGGLFVLFAFCPPDYRALSARWVERGWHPGESFLFFRE